MIDIIMAEFKQGLKENTWIDEKAKRLALEKANNMGYQVGYSSLLDSEIFQQKFRNVNVFF
jgi:predicted metalloendopeptidase